MQVIRAMFSLCISLCSFTFRCYEFVYCLWFRLVLYLHVELSKHSVLIVYFVLWFIIAMEMVWLSDSRCCTGSRSFTSRFKSHSLGSDLPPFPCGRIMVGLVLGCSHQQSEVVIKMRIHYMYTCMLLLNSTHSRRQTDLAKFWTNFTSVSDDICGWGS